MDLYRRAEYRPCVVMADGGQIYRLIGTRQDGQMVAQKLGPAASELDILDPDVLGYKLVAAYLD